MIPEAKQSLVRHALQKTFGASNYEEIKQLTAGLSTALIYCIEVKGKPYLLRIITSEHTMHDPTHWFAWMNAGAEAGLAPRVHYMSIVDRICITDFIEAKPFTFSKARVQLPQLISNLHKLPPFPNRVKYLDVADGWVKKFQAAKTLPESITDEIFKQYNRVFAIYPRNTDDMFSSHNDLKPENIVFDGVRPWLVDWEAAFLNDRYHDLAVVANFVVMNENDEVEFLYNYFGKEANEYQHARFFLMRQLLHIYYLVMFMSIVASKGKCIDPEEARPDFRDFHNRMWAGEISLVGEDAKLEYAWIHLQQFLRNIQTDRFEDAMRTVSEYHIK
jgi:thiamine kinase-like enzyme